MSHYPSRCQPRTCARRSTGAARVRSTNALTKLWGDKLVHRGPDNRLVLTQPGLREAIHVAQAHTM